MSVLVVGISHKSAPVEVLERLALDADGTTKLLADVIGGDHVAEATAIVTCNRLEVYAEVDRFHGSVEDVSGLLVARAGESTEALLPHLYVHYDEGAVSHLFQVASGLDSMVVGESCSSSNPRQVVPSAVVGSSRSRSTVAVRPAVVVSTCTRGPSVTVMRLPNRS